MASQPDTERKIRKDAAVLTVNSLKGRQSVRATFRLSVQAIDLLSIAATQLGIKQKSLVDQLVEDPLILSQVAGQITESPWDRRDLLQKTFVLSRSALESLNTVSRQCEVSRDTLVELSIQRLMPLISQEQEKQNKREHLLADIRLFMDQGSGLLETVRTLLGQEDPVYEKLETLMGMAGRIVSEIREIVDKGKCLERLKHKPPDRPSGLKG